MPTETVDGWKTVDVSLQFDRYIAQPYWLERNLLINVAKQVNTRLGDAKKEQAINAALEKMGKTRDEYNQALIRAERAFYTVNDKNPDLGDGEIIIPARQFLSFVNHASMKCPKAIPRIPEKGLTFRGMKFVGVEGFTTGKTKNDAEIFSRFVKLEESNQRILSESSYIADFTARGTLRVSEALISPTNLRKLVEWGGTMLGIGAARPQGFGGVWWVYGNDMGYTVEYRGQSRSRSLSQKRSSRHCHSRVKVLVEVLSLGRGRCHSRPHFEICDAP